MAILGLGLAIRIIALSNIEIINPDGILYIYQAKAISTHQWHLITECQLGYLSLYPLLISLFHLVFAKWVLSAQLVSLCFGFGMLVVLYLLLLQFFNPTISQLTLLLYSFIPIFVRYSVDAMRDATFWFFFTASIWMFILHNRKNSGPSSKEALLFLFGSSCLMLVAGWVRIEGISLLPVSCFFIVIAKGKQKLLRLAVILLPLIIVSSIILLTVVQNGPDILSLTRLDSIAQKTYAPFDAYQNLSDQLSTISIRGSEPLNDFLPKVRNMIWLIALGTIISNAMESFFYPYVPFFCLGIISVRERFSKQPENLYLILILISSFLLLYIHTLQYWIMTYRFICLLILPACVLAGLGIEKSIGLLRRSLKISEKRAVVAIMSFIVAVAVVKNIGPIEDDKDVYNKIADAISERSHEERPIGIAALPSTVHMWVQFYANADYPEPLCHKSFSVQPQTMKKLKSFMKSRGIEYFLWEESLWKKRWFGKMETAFGNDFVELGRWYHKDPGKVVLFRLKDS